MSPRLTAAAVFVVLLVASCGGSSPAATPTPAPAGATATPAPAGATATPAPTQTGATATTTATSGAADPCAVFTAAELKTVTGADYGDGVADAYGQCTWRVGGATVNNGDGQVVAAFQAASLDTIKSMFTGGTDVSVSGHAGYWNGAQGLQSIWVDLGGRLLVLSFDPVGPETQAIAQQLAELAVSHI